MSNLSKRQRANAEKIKVVGKTYPIEEALQTVKDCATAKFDESIDVSINLGIDPKKSEQSVRGAVILPNGTGKKVRIAVFAQGEQAEAAIAAGADRVGLEDLAEAMKGGELNYDIVIATPDTMRVVGQLGQLLGPRGLMPNPKVGTVNADAAMAVKNAKAGQVRYRTDKSGIVQCTIGKGSFEVNALKQNLETLLVDVKKNKPHTAKGIYLKKITLSSTMGPGVVIDQTSLVE